MYEHKSQPMLPWKKFLSRLLKHFLATLSLFAFALGLGVLGYYYFAGFSWLDSLLNASMLLSGMGPVGSIDTASGKIFASAYALFSGLVFTAGAGITVAPIIHRLLHRLHLQESEEQRQGDRDENN